jgi:hypothetical protein
MEEPFYGHPQGKVERGFLTAQSNKRLQRTRLNAAIIERRSEG